MGGPVHGQERRRLGQPVYLDELPSQVGGDALNGPRRWRGTGDYHPDGPPPRDGLTSAPARLGGVQYRRYHRRRPAHQRHPVLIYPAQDLFAVYFAQDDLFATHTGYGVRHAPTVAMEHRQRVQVNIPVCHRRVPTEGGRVEPAVPVSQLHSLWPGGGPAGVVDAGGHVLVALPLARAMSRRGFGEQGGVGVPVEDDPLFHRHARQRFLEFRVDE